MIKNEQINNFYSPYLLINLLIMSIIYNFTKPEFLTLKYVGANPEIISTSALTANVIQNTNDISSLQLNTQKNNNDIITISATTENKSDIGHHHLTDDIDNLNNYTGLTNYLSNLGGQIDGDLIITGKLAVNGGIITVTSTTVTTTSNVIKLNEGEAGNSVTAGSSGIEINRGTAPRYELKFYENADVFRLGMTGNTQAIATREDNPINNYIPIWDDTNKIFITSINPNTISLTSHTHTFNNITNLNEYSGFTNYYLIEDVDNLLSNKTNTGTTLILHNNINTISANTITNANDIISVSALTLTKILDDRTVGCITSPNLVDNNNGTATISSVEVFLRNNPNYLGQIEKYYISGGTFSFIDGNEEYIAVKYNNGFPIMYKETSGGTINNSDIIPLFTCWRLGNTIHSLNFDSIGSGLANKLQSAEYHKALYIRSSDGGLILNETLTPTARTITITSGVIYTGAISQNVSNFNSNVDQLTETTISNGTWSYKDVRVYNNTQYNTPTGLVEMTNNNKWGVVWFYRSIGDAKQTFYVLGSDEYNNEAAANTSSERTDLPLVLRKHCILVGRILIQKNANSGVIQSAFDVRFTPNFVLNHNDTNNKQGGNGIDQFYHLTEPDYTNKIINMRFGNVTGGTYTEFETTGFEKMVGSATYWEDINFPVIIRTTGTNTPSIQPLIGGITSPRWAINDYYACDTQELFHKWKEGSTCYWHLHMLTNGTDATDRYVKWEVEYAYVKTDGQISSATTTSYEYLISGGTPDKTMKIVSISNFTPPIKIGSHIYAKLKRITSTGTAPTNDPFCGMLQLHVECDTLGSRTIMSK